MLLQHLVKIVIDYASTPYATPKGYIKWTKLIERIKPSLIQGLSIVANYEKTNKAKSSYTRAEEGSITITKCISLKVPVICIDANIAEAFIATDIKPMPSPEPILPCFIFLLPLKLKHLFKFPAIYDVDINFDSVFVYVYDDYLHVVFTGDNSFADCTYTWAKPHKEGELKDRTITSSDVLLERLIKNAVLAFIYEPKYLTEEIIKDTKGKGFSEIKDDKNNTPMPVRWLGKAYKTIVHRTKHIANSTDTKRSIRSHWRRGHWHTTCCGPNKKQRRQKWFKPVFVSSNSLETTKI
jgi:hypothetical protein